MKDYFGLKDKVCVVTGSSNGMGKATAEMLIDLGAKVYAVSRRKTNLPGLAGDIICDVSQKEQIDEAFKQIPEQIDRFFGIAGVSGLHHDLLTTFKINFVANKYITEEYLDKRMVDGGAIVFCTSSGGLGWELPQCKEEYIGLMDKVGRDETVEEVKRMGEGCEWLPGPLYYGVSKRALNYYVAHIIEHFAKRKIRVNAVLPMGTDTGLKADFAEMAGDEESMIENGTGLAKRLSQPREMAEPMVFLASAYHPSFRQEKLGGKNYADGVFVDSLPIRVLVENGYKDIIAVRIPGGGLVKPYTIPEDGSLTVNKFAITLTAVSASKTYDGTALISKTVETSKLANTEHSLSCTLKIVDSDGNEIVPVEAGTYYKKITDVVIKDGKRSSRKGWPFYFS